MFSREGRVGRSRILRSRHVKPREHFVSARKRAATAVLAIATISVVAILMVPPAGTQGFPTREGGNCDDCHDGGIDDSIVTVTGLPVGNYVPGQDYALTVTIVDPNGAIGENNFDLILSGTGPLGTLSTSDPNVEINSATEEASANDAVSPMTATSWTLTWTAPATGDPVTITVWAVAGDDAGGSKEPVGLKTYSYTAIPEFSTMLVPIAGVVGAVLLAARAARRKQK